MKLLKIGSFFKPQKLKQNTIEPELFKKMLATCPTAKDKKLLYSQANSLPNDIVVLSVQENEDKLLLESSKSLSLQTEKDYRDYIHSIVGTFISYTEKAKPDLVKQLKISDEVLIPPNQNTMRAISDKLSRV